MKPTTLFSAVGLFTSSVLVVKILSIVGVYLRPSRLRRYAHLSRDGKEPWAMVTGATDGVGLAFARELAAHGFNLVLHGRNPEKLGLVRDQLRESFPTRSFRIIIADAGDVECKNCYSATQSNGNSDKRGPRSPPWNFTSIKRELDDINLTVLINNAGGGPVNPVCLSVAESSESRITENISLNALFPFHLTRTLLPSLIRHSPSLVMNISSLGDDGYPLLALYSASKAFLMTETRALRLEMEFDGLQDEVEILGVRLGRVTGARGSTDPPSIAVPNAETMAKAALARAGYHHGIVIGYWGHALQNLGAVLLGLLPRWLEDKVIVAFMRKQSDYFDRSIAMVKQL